MIMNKTNAAMQISAMANLQPRPSGGTGLMNAFIPSFADVMKNQMVGTHEKPKSIDVKEHSEKPKVDHDRPKDLKEVKPEAKPKDKEIHNNQAKELRRSTKTEKVEENDEENQEKVKDPKEEAAMEMIAQMLGMDVQKIKDLLEAQTKDENSLKLDEVISGKPDLAEQMKKIMEMLKEKIEQLMKSGAQGNADWKEALQKVFGDLAKNDDFKEAVSELKIALTDTGKQVKESLNQGMGNGTENSIRQEAKKDSMENEAQGVSTESVKEVKAGGKTSEGNMTGFGSFGFRQAIKETTGAKVDSHNANTNDFMQAFSKESGKMDSIMSTMKTLRTTVVNRQDVINQIIDKAKFTLTADKSEMTMQLKPDNLGKLSLQVVSERGAMVAKMTAENDQVKAIIESNLQTLKDSLLKQGITVQSFSVSVGQEQQRNTNFGSEFGNNQKHFKHQHEGNGVKVSGIVGDIKRNIVNPYEMSDNRINLTA